MNSKTNTNAAGQQPTTLPSTTEFLNRIHAMGREADQQAAAEHMPHYRRLRLHCDRRQAPKPRGLPRFSEFEAGVNRLGVAPLPAIQEPDAAIEFALQTIEPTVEMEIDDDTEFLYANWGPDVGRITLPQTSTPAAHTMQVPELTLQPATPEDPAPHATTDGTRLSPPQTNKRGQIKAPSPPRRSPGPMRSMIQQKQSRVTMGLNGPSEEDISETELDLAVPEG